jgi:hypothetical protein
MEQQRSLSKDVVVLQEEKRKAEEQAQKQTVKRLFYIIVF